MDDLADRQAITDLVSALGRWLDEKRFDEARTIFVEEVAVRTPGGTSRGIELVVDQARRNHAADRTQHLLANVLIDFEDPDHANVSANLVVTFVPDTDAPGRYRTLGGRYAIAAHRTAAGWRLASLVMRPIWDSAAAA